jgi:hypothetical protein
MGHHHSSEDIMPGVQDTIVYSGPEGFIRHTTGLGVNQYHAVRQTPRGPKGRYYDTQRGALAWLRKHAKDQLSPQRG